VPFLFPARHWAGDVTGVVLALEELEEERILRIAV
jgi:hypothetical protein